MRISSSIALVLFVAGCSAAAATPSSSEFRASGTSPGSGTTSDGAGAPSSDPTPSSGTRSGNVELRLVDAPNPDVSSVVVTIDHVDANIEGTGWTTIASTPATVDLLALQGGAFASLSKGGLPAGHIEQLRLYLSATTPGHVVTSDGQFDLKVPSGTESGIKIVGGFDVGPCQTGQVTIDFDAAASVSYRAGGAGSAGGGWTLRPVVRLKSVSIGGECPEADADAGASSDVPADSDAGTPSCDDVTCVDGSFCLNGSCTTAS